MPVQRPFRDRGIPQLALGHLHTGKEGKWGRSLGSFCGSGLGRARSAHILLASPSPNRREELRSPSGSGGMASTLGLSSS